MIDLYRDIGVGDVLQVFQDQAVEGFGAVGRQFPIQAAVDFAQGGGTVDDIAVVFLGMNVLTAGGQVGGEFTDDLFENVLQCHQSQHIAVFVHHDADAAFGILEVDQLLVQGGALWDKVGLHRVLHQLRLVDVFLEQQTAQFAQVQQADHVVRVAVEYWQASVLAGTQSGEDFMHVILEINAHHFVTGHHDVFHGHRFQIEDVEQHLLVVFRDQAAGLVDDCAQLFRTQVIVVLIVGTNSAQPQQHHADTVDHPHQGCEQDLQGFQQHTGREGDPFRFHGRIGLRGDFGKHQHDDGDYHRRHGGTAVAEPADRQNGGHGGGEVVDEIVADQDDGQQSVSPLEQTLHPGGGLVALTGQVAQTIAVDRHHAGFTAGKEGRAKNQGNQGAYQPPVRIGIQRKSRLSASRPAIVRAGGWQCQATSCACWGRKEWGISPTSPAISTKPL